MPALLNPKYEAFAQARAAGALLDDAYEAAGFVLHRGHSSRLACRPEVAERVAELRAQRAAEEDHTPQAVLAALFRIARAGEASDKPAQVKEARLALIDALRLYADLRQDQAWERTRLAHVFKELSEMEGDAAAPGEAAPKSASPARRQPAASPQAARDLPGASLKPAQLLPNPAARLPEPCPAPTARLPGLGGPPLSTERRRAAAARVPA